MLGRNWIMHINLDWQNPPSLNHVGTLPSDFSTITATSGDQTLDSVLEQYSEMFQPELGCYTGKPVALKESQGAKFHKARPIPYALQSKVESTLLKMER